MPLTPDQFKNTLKEVIKEDIQPELNEIKINIANMTDSVDTVLKKYENHETEHASNLVAHKRIMQEINKLRKHLKMDPIKIV